MNGLFITFEGGEGCGKSTQIKLLCNYLKSLGRDCIVTREPGGTPISEKIRELLLHSKEGEKMYPLTELLLFGAARAQHVNEFIMPSIKQGKIVICDRFIDSTLAYQGKARSLGEIAKSINNIAISNCLPNLTILLDVPVEIGLQRASIRDNGITDRMGSQKIEFYNQVRNAYLNLAKENPNRIVVIDSSGDEIQTFQKIKFAIQKFL